ncbi:MAG: class I SAM-dependent methyltransferase, partial [Bacteroidales bacterium]|nr:class I SAM-dependent methyltransferase [Bacteroidales bacterium]
MKNNSLAVFKLMFIFSCTMSSLSAQTDLSEPFEREQNKRQAPEIVLPAAGVEKGMIIGEVGAGRGRYTVYLAKAAGPEGKVYANDINETSLSYLKGRCGRLGITNVSVITGKADDPGFPENTLDIAIMVLVYHMISSPDELLKNLKKSMKPGSKLVIVDPHDKYIDEEFGIDRSKPGEKPPT